MKSVSGSWSKNKEKKSEKKKKKEIKEGRYTWKKHKTNSNIYIIFFAKF